MENITIMGAGCTCQSSTPTESRRIRVQRMGNFTYMVHENRYSGQGCKRTQAWETTATREEVAKKCDEFWNTQVEGNEGVWNVLRAAASQSPSQAEQLLKASGLRLMNGLMTLIYDDRGNRYELPPFVLNQAVKYGVAKSSPGLPENHKKKTISIILRCARFQDFQVTLSNEELIKSLKLNYAESKQLDPLKLRFFYCGREMKDEFKLAHYKVENQVVIQVLSL